MDSNAEQQPARYEIKMLFQESAWKSVHSFLQTHPAAVRTHHPPRYVQSIYFDTPGNRAVQQNLSGQGDREKIRFRWYGEAASSVEGALECKIRRNEWMWKKRFPITRPLRVADRTLSAFARELMTECSPEWRGLLDSGLDPVQWIAYDRAYFITGDSSVRITVDRNLEAYDLRQRPALFRSWATPLPSVTIVEFKADLEHCRELQDVSGEFPFTRDRCSKFMLASCPKLRPSISHFPE